MSNVYVHFSQISFPARYSVVNFQLVSHSLRFREVIIRKVYQLTGKNSLRYVLCRLPTDAVYSATKAYIMSFSNALRGELSKTGIKITTLCPGATKTEFAAKANIQNTLLFRIAVMKPEKVVEIAYRKMMKGRRLVIPGIYNKLLVVFSKVMPISLTNRITVFMMR